MRFSDVIAAGEYADEDESLAQRDVEGATFHLIIDVKNILSNILDPFCVFLVMCIVFTSS